MSIVEFEAFQQSLPGDNKIIHSGYCYSHLVTNNEWIQFHVDDVDSVCEHYIGPFGGNVSVRSPAGSKPLTIFGQDELIFNQFSHSGKQWLGPSGQCSIMPKTAGMGIMLLRCKFINSQICYLLVFALKFQIDKQRLIVTLQFG